jgi:hypothetical protein
MNIATAIVTQDAPSAANLACLINPPYPVGPFGNGDSISRCHCANRKGLEARTLTVFAGNAKLLCDQTGFSLTDDNDNVANRR